MRDFVADAWNAEEALLRPEIRGDSAKLESLLAADFVEIGQSGRRWSRAELIAALVAEVGVEAEDQGGIALDERAARLLTSDLVLLTYRLNFRSRLSWRSSLWRSIDGSVQCLFHQGSATSDGEGGGMTDSWDLRVAQYWETVDRIRPEEALQEMQALIGERSEDDAEALYEWASVHDYLGMEEQAIPLYEAALERGLAGKRRPQAIIQLASSLRNIGRPGESIRLLREHQDEAVTGDAAQASLALALRDLGRNDEALSTALMALARILPMYRHAVETYANELVSGSDEGDRP